MTNLTRDELVAVLLALYLSDTPVDFGSQADAILAAQDTKIQTAIDAEHEFEQWYPVREFALAGHGYTSEPQKMAYRDGWDVALLNAERLGFLRDPDADECVPESDRG